MSRSVDGPLGGVPVSCHQLGLGSGSQMERRCRGLASGPQRRDSPRETLALDQLHRDVGNAALDSGLEDRADPGVVELRSHLGLAPESGESLPGRLPDSAQDFQRYPPVEARVLREVDDSLATPTEFPSRSGTDRCVFDRRRNCRAPRGARTPGRRRHRHRGTAEGTRRGDEARRSGDPLRTGLERR